MVRLAIACRKFAAALIVVVASGLPALALSEKATATLKMGGHVILMRHGQTEGGLGDPPGFKLGDCATQRNLSGPGAEDVRGFGEALRANAIAIDRIVSSPWCRCTDTAKLTVPGREPEIDASLSSFFEVRGQAERRDALAKLRATIAAWTGPGNLLMVSHQQTIAALAGLSLPQGAMLILKPRPGGFDVVVREQP